MDLVEFKFELGEVLEDKITGFKGAAMARAEYFTDCIHYGLCSRELQAGKPVDWEWFDEMRLVQVRGVGKINREERESKNGKPPTSGAFPDAPQA